MFLGISYLINPYLHISNNYSVMISIGPLNIIMIMSSEIVYLESTSLSVGSIFFMFLLHKLWLK